MRDKTIGRLVNIALVTAAVWLVVTIILAFKVF
jgi:hypothetical protein